MLVDDEQTTDTTKLIKKNNIFQAFESNGEQSPNNPNNIQIILSFQQCLQTESLYVLYERET